MTTQVLPGVTYIPRFVEDPDATEQQIAEEIGLDALEPRTASMGGRPYKVPRLEAWYGPHPYRFNGATFPARPLFVDLRRSGLLQRDEHLDAHGLAGRRPRCR